MGDPYTRITDSILRQIETAGPGAWVCPWHRTHGSLPRNALTGRTYRGINVLSLWCGGRAGGLNDARWATYRQWAELGAQVRKGERGTGILYYRDLTNAVDPAIPSPGDSERRFIARSSTVFNAGQVDGAPALPETLTPPIDPTPVFDRFVAATGAVIQLGDAAAYLPARDAIRMPTRERFHTAEGYCATLAHELVHWTGAPHRLARELTTRFRTRAYAAEELVAELGAAFILAGLDLASTPHPNHAAYIAGWLPLLHADPRALVTAAALASHAADHLTEQASCSSASAPYLCATTTKAFDVSPPVPEGSSSAPRTSS
ncbi:DUF1738 domain-containing protein [Methylobacterium sp. WL64]|uniref:ArdC family protein n=1 Tax=Methylobacterium sp. WL64 TaxID=2603894 RepID=UPI0011CC458D|nr:zincin-like metallopeptidase domain-containing protein [Methylobacterium sp. WL64]TXN00724.1 DUF1738 domain-containing protein [Methylobacterium sp. WL64]